MKKILGLGLIALTCGCVKQNAFRLTTNLPQNVLNYLGTPQNADDRTSLSFSDQGAWFAYGFQSDSSIYGGFSGPFLMTQENGKWLSPALAYMMLNVNKTPIKWQAKDRTYSSYSSHLEQTDQSANLLMNQKLFFTSAHTALVIATITNTGSEKIAVAAKWHGHVFPQTMTMDAEEHSINFVTPKSTVRGYLSFPGSDQIEIEATDSTYSASYPQMTLKAKGSITLLMTQSFIFPNYDWSAENEKIKTLPVDWQQLLSERISEKEMQRDQVTRQMIPDPDSTNYLLAAKAMLTLQNNWREAAGELKHDGLFPSYHYEWFHGFWAWDSWKHAVALAQYDTKLAKDQVRAMYDYMSHDGFLPDCIYRDTTIENHNYRNTKPPLSAWAVWEIYLQDKDTVFLKELYPKILKQHAWWYLNRDHDTDGLCEYGSTDGSLIAAKWESGMDNAVRFDGAQLLRNNEHAYSLDQESVDLNAYLYAEKLYLAKIAGELKLNGAKTWFEEAAVELKIKFQQQFYDSESGWFYDTSIDGKEFVKVMGCEGWIPLWAMLATPEQAAAVDKNMLNAKYFNTFMPLPTLAANHPKFQPDRGYWRGPTWIDQAYWGVQGLKQYGFSADAQQLTDKLIHNAEGVTILGEPIRENYNPLTGGGENAQNFSWSAALYLLLLLN